MSDASLGSSSSPASPSMPYARETLPPALRCLSGGGSVGGLGGGLGGGTGPGMGACGGAGAKLGGGCRCCKKLNRLRICSSVMAGGLCPACNTPTLCELCFCAVQTPQACAYAPLSCDVESRGPTCPATHAPGSNAQVGEFCCSCNNSNSLRTLPSVMAGDRSLPGTHRRWATCVLLR